MNKKVLNFLVIVVLSFITFWWTFLIFHYTFDFSLVISVIILRMLASYSIFSDYNLSWSKSTTKTFLMKSIVYIIPFFIYATYYYGEFWLSFLTSELFLYLFIINFLMYGYNYIVNRSKIKKSKSVVIYGSGSAGLRLENEFENSEYKIVFFVDDSKEEQNRSINSIQIISPQVLKQNLQNKELDMLVIAIPSSNQLRINEIYEEYYGKFKSIKVLPSIKDVDIKTNNFKKNLKDISVEDLLARRPQDLDKVAIKKFIENKIILVSGAGGSIGSECVRQCINYKASLVILVDNSEYNLYNIHQEINSNKAIPIMQSITDKKALRKTFQKYNPDIVIHAAAYKHVPLCEINVEEAIKNNIIGTKNIIDISCEYKVKNIVLTSTDKAVRPTNVMGATKRICELYAQNILSKHKSYDIEITSVRFGNVLGSSGSVIPKFKSQIEKGENLTVTHKDVTRYFMLIPEACELVLQAASIGKGGEVFILDMGKPIKIFDLAKKMIKLSGKENLHVEIIGLRKGEKLYEELLISESDKNTKYKSITIAKPTEYDIDKLNKDIMELTSCEDKLTKLKDIVPEFQHRIN